MILIDTNLPDQIQDKVALSIGPLLERLLVDQPQRPTNAELEYTFPCWFLGLKEISVEKALRDSATPTHLWHHQILLDGKAQVYAHSSWQSNEPDTLEVVEVSYSDLAADLEQTLEWIANQEESEDRLRLLLVPSLYITCFWLMSEEEDHVVVAQVPSDYTHLTKNCVYPASEFLHILNIYSPR